MKKIRRYLSGVMEELKKVTFPGKDEVWQMTSLVVAISLVLAIAMGLCDFVFRTFIRWLVT